MQQTYFVSGVAGFLGSHLADALISQGHRVIGVDSLIGGYHDNVNSQVEFHQFDLLNLEALMFVLKGVDVIYHCAALPHEGFSVFSPHQVVLNGSGVTTALLSAAVANGVKRFVFCSSTARYGFQPVMPFTEDMKPNPQDPYGVDKLASEMQVRCVSKAHNMEYVIVVPHNIIGPRQKYDDPYRNVASIMINRMLRGQQPIIYGDGEQTRSFSPVQDIVPLLLKAGYFPKAVGEVINVGPDDETVTVNELSRRIARLLNFGPLEPIYYNDRPQEVKKTACSADKSRQLLGYHPTVSLDESLRELIKYIRGRGPRPFHYHLKLEIDNDRTPKTWKDRLI